MTLLLVFQQAARLIWTNSKFHFISNIALVVGSVTVALIVFEGFLWFNERSATPGSGYSPYRDLTVPEEWRRKPAKVPGARVAFYWHGKLHVHGKFGLRRAVPYPPKREDVFRIIVVGDSLTYGVGIADEDTYVSRLGKALAQDCSVETFNQGLCGANSTTILRWLRYAIPKMRPDLIIYGICINDYLPYNHSQYDRRRHLDYGLPLPMTIKPMAVKSSRVGMFLNREFDDLMIRLGLRYDYLGAILHDFENFKGRFQVELKEMNALANENGCGPMIAIVVNSKPKGRGKQYEVKRLTERLAARAGMTVVSMEEYDRKFDGRSFRVSRWEGHPNEEAHELFADYLLPIVRRLPSFKRFCQSHGRRPEKSGTESTEKKTTRDLTNN